MKKPMLAGKAPSDLALLKYPLLASPKLDGIRCVMRGGKALSRKLIEIPNLYVQSQLANLPDGLDGELMLALPGNFNEVQSAVMSVEGEPKFTYCVFDTYNVGYTYEQRLQLVEQIIAHVKNPRVEIVPHTLVTSPEQLADMEDSFLKIGFEGVMLRSIDGPYKCGRSTEREGFLLKLKRFDDDEATIVGFVEMMHNDNEATTNEVGATKRSSAKEGKRPAGVLGALQCVRDDGVEFEIGSGFTAAQREDLWMARGNIIGERAKFKFQPDPSAPEGAAPRFPVYLGIRAGIDS